VGLLDGKSGSGWRREDYGKSTKWFLASVLISIPLGFIWLMLGTDTHLRHPGCTSRLNLFRFHQDSELGNADV